MKTSAARLALFGLLAGLTVVQAAAGAASVRMTLNGGLLTAEIAGAPLRQVMEEVGRLTGAEVRWLGAAGDERISLSFADVPLADAIGRMLGARSFLLVAPAAGSPLSIIRVDILASGQAPRLEPDTPAAPSEHADDALDAALATALAHEEPAARLRAIDELAQVAQQEPRAWMVLTELSNREADGAVRAAARQALDAGLAPSPREAGVRGRRRRAG